MVKVTISQEVIDWLSSKLDCSEEDAMEFAQVFIKLLRASGGLKTVRRSKPRPDKFHPVDVAILGGDPSL